MSLSKFVHRAKNLYPQNTALIYTDRQVSYAELPDRLGRCAAVLRSFGHAEKSRVCILALNSDYGVECYIGAMWAGMIPNSMNIRWTTAELSASIDDCQASILIVDDAFLSKGIELKEKCASIDELIFIGGAQSIPEGIHKYADLMDSHAPIEDHSGDADDIAFINYTGGTTGKGKGVVHTHRSHGITVMTCVAEEFFRKATQALALPLFHIGSISIVNSCFATGSTLVIPPPFNPKTMMAAIEKHQIELVALVPTMIRMILDDPDFKNYDLTSLKSIRYGGSPIDETLLLRTRKELPWADLMQIYGQTEGFSVTFLHHIDHDDKGVAAGKTRSAGIPALGVSVAIRDPEGKVLPAGQTGEITFKAGFRMREYWNMPEKSAETIKENWLYTGDAGYLSEDGYLFVVDRIKDMIITGGENVYSAEVENALSTHPDIQQCAVIGLPDEKWGEIVHAEIVLKPNASLTLENVVQYCRPIIAGYKIPKHCSFVEAIPLTSVGKVDKAAIRAKFT